MKVNSLFTSLLLAILIWVAIFYASGSVLLSFIIYAVYVMISLIILIYNRQLWTVFLISFLGLLFGLYLGYYDYQNKDYNSSIIDRFDGLYIEQVGVIKEVYKRSEFSDQYVIWNTQIWNSSITSDILSLITVPKNFSLYPGQEIRYMSKIYKIKDFDMVKYKNYMLSKNIYYTSKTNSIETLVDRRYGFRYVLYDSRQKLLEKIYNLYPKREAIFLAGILLWAREDIPQDLKDNFNNSGLTHFIAVSGFNITLCVIFIWFLFQFFPMKIRIIWVSIWIILFAFFVGLGAPVVRASIMWIIAYLFLQSWTSARNISLLAFTAVVMVTISPLILLYDLSFHLSFLAVIWIIYTQDFFKRIFVFVPNAFAIREALVLTLWAMVFSLPVMLFQFWQIPLLSPIANIIVTWTIPIAMLLWSMSLLMEIIYEPLWEISAFVAWIFLRYDMLVVETFWWLHSFILKVDVWPYRMYLQALYFIVIWYIVTLYHMWQKK